MDETTKEIQQNELDALRAIFMDDFEDVKAKTAWNVKQDAPEFRICVRPVDEELKEHVWAGLHVRFSKTYPRTVPQLTVESGRGLSDAQISDAQMLVKQQAAAMAGGEMIYELTLLLSDFITQHNSAALAARPSFYQQMVERQQAGARAEREREQAEQRKMLMERQRMHQADMEEQADLQRRIHAELERKQQEIQSDAQRQQHLSDIADAVHNVAGRWAEGIQLLSFTKPICLDPQTPRNGWFTTVALEESTLADALCTIYDAYPTDLVDASIHLSDRFTVQCFSVTAAHYVTDQGYRQLDHIQSRIADLAQIRHPNLVSVYGCHLQTVEGPGLCLWVLSDPLLAHDGSTLEDVLESCGAIAMPQARTYLRHILLALVSLHAAGFVHRSAMPGNVLLTKEARGKFNARLFNAQYREEIIELHRQTPLSESIGDYVGNDIRVAPEVVDRPDMMGRKNDVWCVGVIGLQMALGVDVLHNVAVGSERAVLDARRDELPPPLFAVLAKMLTVDYRQRPTALEALNDPFFLQGLGDGALVHRQALDSASRGLTFEMQRSAHVAEDARPPAFFSVAQSNVAGYSSKPVQNKAQPPKTAIEPVLRPSTSRYHTDFEEIEFLGKGGFGSVVKARNRIDGRFYAIKKIKLNARETEGNRKIYREVTTLSRLHHQNVVRYYTTWVEDVDITEPAIWGNNDDGNSSSDGDADQSGIGLSLSHSSWSTEDDAASESSSSEGSSAAHVEYYGGVQSEVDIEFGSSSSNGPSAGRSQSSNTGETDKELQEGDRVFSAIRFGTMGAGDGGIGTRQRAGTDGPIREFNDSEPLTSSRDQATDSDLSGLLLNEQQRSGYTDLPLSHQQKSAKKRQILYIQMEYCENKTLSDLIREGLDEKESWRLFRQILEGLKHIHQRGVIHRDLKPVNAFLDAAGEIKIGDFGLATSSFASIDMGAAQRLASLDRSVAEDALTADIGTSTYVAPEVVAKSSGATRYNQKVDMYSLGIIFFEMCYPMRTGMERATVLHNLRKPEIVFPADFPFERMSPQVQIIRRLLNHSPRQRPSSAELLESDMLPARLEDEHVWETIRTIANPTQPYFPKLLESLFSHPADKHIDATYEFRANDVHTEQLNAVFLDRIRELMTRVFRMHAAVELSAPPLMPHTDPFDTQQQQQKPAIFVDERGHVVQLPCDQTAPFARYVARTQMTEIKRYCFDRYFIANAAGGQPISRTAASFDAVTNYSAHAVAAAEVVSVACEVFDALPAFRGMSLTLTLNHMAILEAVFAYCGLLHPQWMANPASKLTNQDIDNKQFIQSLAACVGNLYWEKPNAVRARVQALSTAMRTKVSSQSLDRLSLFVGICGDFNAVQREVLARIGSECGMSGTPHAARGAAYVRAAIRGFNELRYVEAMVRHFGVTVPLVCAPLFSCNYVYYQGAYAFQLATDRGRGRAPQVLATGGRYDGLLRRFRHLAGNALLGYSAVDSSVERNNSTQSADEASMSFARRIGSLHSTDVWQQMFTKPHEAVTSPTSPTASGTNVSIGTQLSQGSAALGTARDVVCIGVQIQLDLVIQEMARYQQQVLTTTDLPTFGLWTRKRCDVVVASFGTRPMLKQRIALARELWANGLRTDFLFNDDPEMTMERLVDICRDQGMNWIVTIKRRPNASSLSGAGQDKYVFKVKNILRRVECEVAYENLCAWLHADIGEQWNLDLQTHEMRGSTGLVSGSVTSIAAVVGREGAVASTGSGYKGTLDTRMLDNGAGLMTSSSAAKAFSNANVNTSSSNAAVSNSGSSSSRLEVVVVNPQHKSKNLNRSKHKQKLAQTDRAVSCVNRIIGETKGSPVLVVDQGPELLRRLSSEPSILSDFGYKRVIEQCSAHQRSYVVELHSYLQRYQREGVLFVWLYSAKGDEAIIYKL
ncbi:eukaryotic translation initiation factor 2-alpha kinase [Coemansia sp. RSA 990]|nr:eukaryotic translation initiation factor 2-alpha kinase [Coemansia sp. RSA 990]